MTSRIKNSEGGRAQHGWPTGARARGWCETLLGTGIVVATAACTGSGEPSRTEPTFTDRWGCIREEMVCGQWPGSPIVDGTDPLWPYCSGRWPGFPTPGYAPGVAEAWWEYADNGSIERIETRCEVVTQVTAERDDAGRVVRWLSSNGPPTELSYDEVGMLSGSRWTDVLGDTVWERTRTFEYDGDGKLQGIAFVESYDGEPYPDTSSSTVVTYESGALSRAMTMTESGECGATREYRRESGRIESVVLDVTCVPFARREEVRFDWSGEELSGARRLFVSDDETWEEEIRFLYGDGRIVEVQRDRDGRPQATYWLDHDPDGRLTHLLWWGHNPEPSY